MGDQTPPPTMMGGIDPPPITHKGFQDSHAVVPPGSVKDPPWQSGQWCGPPGGVVTPTIYQTPKGRSARNSSEKPLAISEVTGDRVCNWVPNYVPYADKHQHFMGILPEITKYFSAVLAKATNSIQLQCVMLCQYQSITFFFSPNTPALNWSPQRGGGVQWGNW